MNPNQDYFPGRVGIQQRALPSYRLEFLDLLAEVCGRGLSVFAGDVQPHESIPTRGKLKAAEFVKSQNYHFMHVQSGYYLLWQRGLEQWLENWRPDVLIVEANPRYLSTNRGIRWMHARGKPVIGWGLGAPTLSHPTSMAGKISTRLRNHLRQRLDKGVNAYIAYSHQGAKEFQALSDSRKPIYIATNAVAKSPPGPPIGRPPEYQGQPKVLFVGRIQARKRIDNLLRSCAALPESLQPELWIVGDGPDKTDLEQLAARIYPRAVFFGSKTGDELASIFAAADLFVLPGTGGLAVQEAMSYSLPVIVAEGDGTQRDLVTPENGWLIAPNDEQALKKSLETALSDPLRLRDMGIQSYQVVKNEVNIEQMVKTFITAVNNTTKETDR